jgi:hypothetical protein
MGSFLAPAEHMVVDTLVLQGDLAPFLKARAVDLVLQHR